jgi:multidrug efflux pump subunit AcrA (membrane-fusion protein)
MEKPGMGKMKKKRALIIGIVIVLIVTAGIGGFLFLRARKAVPQDISYVVREEVYQNVIEISGNIKAAQEQNIQAAGDGIVEEVYVKEGDRVRAGQLLFRLDDSQERYNLANHEFQMNQERINGTSAKLALMEEQREVLLKNIRDRSLEARFDGVIGQLTLAKGDYAKAQDIFGYLIDRSYLKATVEVVETDASRLKAGQMVRLVFPAYPDLAVEGVVVSYPAVGRITTRGATALDTEIRIDNPPDEILPGYSFTGEIIGGPAERILTVESAAIAYENGRAYVDRISVGRRAGPGAGQQTASGSEGEARGPGAGRRGTGADAGEGSEPGTGRRGSGTNTAESSGQGAGKQEPAASTSEGSEQGSGRRGPTASTGEGGERGSGRQGSAASTGEGGEPGTGRRGPAATTSEGNAQGVSHPRVTDTAGEAAPERVAVEVVPYGRNMVRILSGLEPGDRLKAQAAGTGFSRGSPRGNMPAQVRGLR